MLEELKKQLQDLVATYKEVITQKVAEIKGTAPVATSAASKTIKGSVGNGGNNKAEDVALVKSLLNKAGANLDATNPTCGPKTIEAIKKFQTEKAGMSKPDGLISPNGNTWKVLNGGASTETTPADTPKTEPTPTVPADGNIEKGAIPADFVMLKDKEVTPELSKAAVHYLNVFCATYPAAKRAANYGNYIRFHTQDGKEFLARFEVHTVYGADLSKPHVPHPSVGLFKNKANA